MIDVKFLFLIQEVLEIPNITVFIGRFTSCGGKWVFSILKEGNEHSELNRTRYLVSPHFQPITLPFKVVLIFILLIRNKGIVAT